MSGGGYHVPVLLGETLELLVGGGGGAGGVYVDGTLGGGGHFRAIAERVAAEGGADGVVDAIPYIVIGIDRDGEAVENARGGGFGGIGAKVIIEQARFSEFDSVLRKYGIDKVQGLFVDLGVSSRQIDEPARGFMYMSDAPLDMRMDQSCGETAAEFLERCGEEELAHILDKYGEVRNARRMALAVKAFARKRKILTSTDLKVCIAREYGASFKIQALAKLFQALRIAVNGELDELRAFLDKSVDYLAIGGRVAVISYHSLEDRMVKEFFKVGEEPCVCDPRQPVCNCNKAVLFRRLTRKAVTAGEDEVKRNPRARSARLRVAERV